MLRSPLLLAALAFALLPFAASGAERRLAYRADGEVWVAKLDGSEARKLGPGSDPEISPDGTKLAYTHTDEQNQRRIAVVDVASGQRTIFTAVPGRKAYGPNWLPDSSALTFHFEDGGAWQLGWAKADGSGFRALWKATDADSALQGVAWQPDGKGFFAYDLQAIHRFDAEGKPQQKWILAKIIPKASFSAGGAISLSPDGRELLLEVDMLEPNPNKEDTNPPSAIWSLEPTSGKSVRITPKGHPYHASPRWLSADEMLFSSTGSKDKKDGVLRMKFGSSERKVVVPKATYPSVSR